MLTRARVEGMTCHHCVRAVFTALAGVDGIRSADVKVGTVEVEHDERFSVDALKEAVRLAGYEVSDATRVRRLPLAGVRVGSE